MHASREIPTAKWHVVSMIVTCLAAETHCICVNYLFIVTVKILAHRKMNMLAWMKLEYIQIVCMREQDYNSMPVCNMKMYLFLHTLNCISKSECGCEHE